MGRREVDVTAPDPGCLLVIKPNERQGLRVVDYDQVVVEVIASGVFERNFFVDLQLQIRQIDIPTL